MNLPVPLRTPDARLLALCAIMEERDRYHDTLTIEEERGDCGVRSFRLADEIRREMASLPTVTVDGLQARLRALGPTRIGHFAKIITDPSPGEQQELDALVRDLLAFAFDRLGERVA